MLRKGEANNVLVFPEADYDNSMFGYSEGQYTFTHKAYGADMFRYSWNFGQNWTTWKNWEDTTFIDKGVFQDSDLFWDNDHILVQCKSTFPFASAQYSPDLG